MVDIVNQATEAVRPARRFEFWRDSVLSNISAGHPPGSTGDDFSASRWVGRTSHGAVISTVSKPIAVERQARNIARDGVDMVCIQTLRSGAGLQQQGDRVGFARPGDIAISDLGRPFALVGLDAYREVRLYMPRAAFTAEVGSVDALAGRVLAGGNPLVGMLAGYIGMSAEAFPRMSDAEAKVMFESVRHLLRGIVQVTQGEPAGSDTSAAGIRAVADAYIERRLHDPALDVREMLAALHVSRSRLYAAYADVGGVRAAIRDARLDRAHARLSAPGDGRRTVVAIALACGFPDHSTFGHAFRHRFGLTPRDVFAGLAAAPM